MPRKKKTAPVEPGAPNIAFVGEKNGHQPLQLINNGDATIVMPEDQSKPFHHAEAKTICKLYGWLYKPVTPKG
jgi:hypothetical protein